MNYVIQCCVSGQSALTTPATEPMSTGLTPDPRHLLNTGPCILILPSERIGISRPQIEQDPLSEEDDIALNNERPSGELSQDDRCKNNLSRECDSVN